MSYAELFTQIEDWVSRKRAEHQTRRTVSAAWISSATAMLAVIISLWIHWHTRQLLVPTERPLIAVVDSKCEGKLNKDTAKLNITLKVILENVGKHPAKNLRMRVWATPVDEPEQLKITRDRTVADPLFPDIRVTWPPMITVQLTQSGDKLITREREVFYYVKMDYTDLFHPENEYSQDFHLVYRVGAGSIGGASVKVKEKFESHLKKVGAI